MNLVLKIPALATLVGLISFATYAQTGVIHESSQIDAAIYSHGCIDDSVLEEFYQADYKADFAQKRALISDELCFFISGMEYSLIENLGNQFSRISGGTSDVRVYTAGNPKLADYGTSIELVVANKYLRDAAVDKRKRYDGYTSMDGLIPYKVWNRAELGAVKISFDVAVPLIDDRPPTKQELGAISRYLVSKESKHERSFVTFYLPEMQVGSGAFAIAHHDPEMQVKMLLFMLHQYPEYRKFAN